MKPVVIQQIEALLQCEIRETQDLNEIYAARSDPFSDWVDLARSVFCCNENREVIGLNLADEEAFEKMYEDDIFAQFPVLFHLQVLNLSRTGTYYYATTQGSCKRREDHQHTYIDIFPYLAQLPNLHTFIHVGNKRLHCVCFLPNLPKLTDLHLNRNSIGNINWIGNLPHTAYLDLRANLIRDIEPLRNLKKLKHLYLGSIRYYKRQNKIVDISPLEHLTDLESLDLDLNKVQNLWVLKNLLKLKNLSLNTVHPQIDFSILRNLTSLERLLLTDNDISDIDFLSPLLRLTFLDISNNPIQSLKPLSKLTNLTYLRMSACHLAAISFSEVFENLHAITRLDISDNDLVDITFLSDLFYLEELNLKGNRVADISVLQSLPKLKKLDLSNHPVTDMSVFKNLYDLEELSINTQQLPYPPIWYVYLKVKKGKLGQYLHLLEPPFIEKLWLLLSSKDAKNELLAKQLAIGQGWEEETLEVYMEFQKKHGFS